MYVAMEFIDKEKLSREIELEPSKVTMGHYKCLHDVAKRHRRNNHYNDVTIRVGERDFEANRMVLGSYSGFFHKKFTTDVNRDRQADVITIDDVKADIVGQLIDFIYLGEMTISRDNVLDIMQASESLEIEDAKVRCTEFLTHALTSTNYRTIRLIGHQYNSPHLIKAANDVIRRCSVDVIRRESFKRMGSDELNAIIENRDKMKISEEEMYTKLIGWVRHDVDERKAKLPQLMELIRLNDLSSKFLNDVVFHEPLLRESNEFIQYFLEILHNRMSVMTSKPTSTGYEEPRGRLLLIGSDKISNAVHEFEISSRQLKRFASNITPRYDSAATVVDQRVYLAGGQVRMSANVTSSIERCDLRDDAPQWSNLRPMLQRRFCFGMTSISGNVFVGGGADQDSSFLSSCEELCVDVDQWMKKPAMMEKRTAHSIVSCNGCVFALGGHNRVRPLDLVESYDPRTSRWRSVAAMTSRRRWMSAAVVGEHIYAIGGDSEGTKRCPLETVEKYDQRADRWISVASMNTKRRGSRACAVGNKIYVAGGADVDTKHSTIEVYDVTADEWVVDFETNEQFLYAPLVAWL